MIHDGSFEGHPIHITPDYLLKNVTMTVYSTPVTKLVVAPERFPWLISAATLDEEVVTFLTTIVKEWE